jgi:hypothetical protein
VAVPEDSQQQMSLYLRQNQLALALGRREAFMANLLPIITDSLDRLQQDAEVIARQPGALMHTGLAWALGAGRWGSDGLLAWKAGGPGLGGSCPRSSST